MSNKKAVARERVKAMREEQARKDRRKEQLMRFGLVGAAIVAVAIIVLAVQASRGGGEDGPVATPAGVVEETGGVPLAEESANVPTVEVWFDFSCPHCAAFEAQNGPTLDQLAESGEANVVQRPVTFVGGSASTRAANAWACAVDEGMGQEFMDATFAQGSGYTNRNLLDIGETLGLDSGDFRSCVNGGTYNNWVSASNGHATQDRGVSSTPTIFVDGEVLDTAMWTPEGLTAAVAAAVGEDGADDADADDADADADDDADDSDGE